VLITDVAGEERAELTKLTGMSLLSRRCLGSRLAGVLTLGVTALREDPIELPMLAPLPFSAGAAQASRRSCDPGSLDEEPAAPSAEYRLKVRRAISECGLLPCPRPHLCTTSSGPWGPGRPLGCDGLSMSAQLHDTRAK